MQKNDEKKETSKSNSGFKKSDMLRKQAEKLLSGKKKDTQNVLTGDVRKLIHELHVHQIELEMQNEELRRAQIEIEESRTKYASLYDFAPVGYFTFNRKGVILETNLTGAKLLAIEKHFLIRTPFILYVTPKFRSVFHSHCQKVFTTGTKQLCEMELRRKNGTLFFVSMESIIAQAGDGNLQCQSIVTDITERKLIEQKSLEIHTAEQRMLNNQLQQGISERKKVEEVLSTSESKYKILMENLPQRIFYKDTNSVYISCNEHFARDLHIKSKEIFGKTDYDFYPEELAKRHRAEDKRIIKSRQIIDTEEKQVMNGEEVIVHKIKTPVIDENGKITGILGILWDITEKVILQNDAERSRHLASLGELAAGVAHEINNPINGIINCAQILFNKSNEGSGEKDIASRIIKEGDRIAHIVSSLLSYAKPDRTENKRHIHIQEILSETLSLTGTQLQKEYIELRLDIPPELPKVMVNPQQIQQVFLNIVNNARHALNQKYSGCHHDKILEVSAEAITMDNQPYVKVIFHDHGAGIPADIIHKVKEPFFTTKPRNEGTGLGLSISYGIIHNHNGRLLIDSVEGKFTRVTVILLPVRKIT